MWSGVRHSRELGATRCSWNTSQPGEVPNKLWRLVHATFRIHWQHRHLLTDLAPGENHHFVPNGRSIYGMNSRLCSHATELPSPAGAGTAQPPEEQRGPDVLQMHAHPQQHQVQTWKRSVPSSDTAQDDSGIFLWLTATWQQAVKHWRQMKALTKRRTTPVQHADKFQGYYPFISTTVRGQQLIWQSVPMRVSRDTWKSFILHSDELVLLECWMLASSQWALYHLNKPK